MSPAGTADASASGSGGIMLPNHAPLVVAEQFGTLATLYPGRIDLGLGRAPGTDGDRAGAAPHLDGADNFPQDVVELMAYFGDRSRPAQRPRGSRRRHPTCRSGSSAPASTAPSWPRSRPALRLRLALRPGDARRRRSRSTARFRPSEQLAEPYVMLAFNVFAADTDARAGACSPRCSRPSSTCAPTARAAAAARRGHRARMRPAALAMVDRFWLARPLARPRPCAGEYRTFVEAAPPRTS